MTTPDDAVNSLTAEVDDRLERARADRDTSGLPPSWPLCPSVFLVTR